ncbi:MAG: ABC transporter permease [bacterium]|jgi:peptide/nickel transport system permease protein
MSHYIVKRLQQSILVILGVSVIVFLIMHLTGDPASLMLPLDTSPEDIAAFRSAMGFDDPLYAQYFRFLKNAVRGDFGLSLRHNQPALHLVLERLPATIELTAAAMLIALVVAIPTGVVAATRRYSAADYIGTVAGLWGQSMPVFWLGIMLILLFAVKLPLFPPSGRGGLSHLVLPAVTLGMYSTATIMRLLRSGMVEVLKQDYIKTARAKGLAGKVVIYKHALKNALIPVATVVGLQFGALLGGAVIAESIFAWPGVGRLAVQAINGRDMPLVQAVVFVMALTIVLINLLTDIAYTYLDPRIRYN